MFIEEVQEWLAEGPRSPVSEPTALPDDFDLDGRMMAVWGALEEMEVRPGRGGWERAHKAWTEERVERWLGAFWAPFQAGIAKRLPAEDRLPAVDVALAAEVTTEHISGTGWSRTVNLSIQRLAERATTLTANESAENDLAEWCTQNALTRASGELTPLGRVLIELRGRDAVEFALAIGAELSVGPGDPWRVGPAGLAAIATEELEFRRGRL